MYFKPQPKTKKIRHRIGKVPITVKVEVWKRDKYTCQMCGKVAPVDHRNGRRIAWGPHHIHHKSLGGKHKVGNLITFCNSCHLLAHRFIWRKKRLGKRRFFTRCYRIINSTYPLEVLNGES